MKVDSNRAAWMETLTWVHGASAIEFLLHAVRILLVLWVVSMLISKLISDIGGLL